MDYFNFYMLTRVFKKLLKNKIFLIIIFFIIFLFFKNVVFGAEVNGHPLSDPPQRILNYLYSIDEYNNNQYYYFIFGYGGQFHIVTFERPQNFKAFMYWTTQCRFRQNSSFRYKSYNLTFEGNLINITYDNVTQNNEWGFGTNNDGSVYFISNFNVYDYNNQDNLIYTVSTSPSILNPTQDIENWSFSTLDVYLGDVQYTNHDVITINYNDNYFAIDLEKYEINDGIISIPQQDINNNIVFVDTASIVFEYDSFQTVPGTGYDLGTYNISLSASTVTQLNSNTDRYIQNNIYINQEETVNAINNQTDAINQQTDAINEQTDLIKDDTVESSASDLPTTDVNNPTENGIDNIFQSIYNAFCVGEAQNIVFPIPFTNKNITLSPYYVRDMLNNNGASWIYTLIQAFWGYLIGRYIISDISRKIDKIKSGNIENVENSNIKEEML